MRKKLILVLIPCLLYVFKSQAQDILISTTGSYDTVTILEITPDLIKFNKAQHSGILYSKLKKEIAVIQYSNGTKEFIVTDTTKQLTASKHVTDKGNKVFIESDNTVEQLTTPYIADDISDWNYWKVVANVNDADFILDLNMRKKGVYVKGFVVIKNKNGLEISHSKSIKAFNEPSNGINKFRGFSYGIIHKYLKKMYW